MSLTGTVPNVLPMTGTETHKAQQPKHKRDLTRRKVVVAGGAAVAAVGVGGACRGDRERG